MKLKFAPALVTLSFFQKIGTNGKHNMLKQNARNCNKKHSWISQYSAHFSCSSLIHAFLIAINNLLIASVKTPSIKGIQ
jgi:hypothetical protein